MNLQTFIVVACVFAACMPPPKHVRCSDKVTKTFIATLPAEYEFHKLGCGGEYSQTTVDELYLDLEIPKHLSQAEAKELLIATVNGYLSQINQSEELKSYLSTFPMTCNQISLSIAFVNENKKPYEDLSQVHLFNGIIYYSKYNKSNHSYTSFATEPF